MKLRRIALVLALVALLVVGLASCVKPPQGSTNAPQGTTAGGNTGNDYDVVFMVDGEILSATPVAAGSPVAQPAKPEKENYSFEGWFVGEEKWNFNKPVEGDMTLVAKFSPKEYAITYNLGGVDAENPNPDTYVYSEDADLYLAPLSAEGMFFLGWSKPAIEAGASGEVEVTARWIAAEKVIRNYGFEANDASGKTYIHYSEMQGEADDESTWWTAPNGTKQYYQSTTGEGGAGLFIQAEWSPNLNHTTGVSVFEGWKSEKTLPTIEYGYNAEGEIVNAWFSSTYGPKVVTGFQKYTENEPYSVSAFFKFGDEAKAAGADDVVINVDFRMKGETAFPINFYLRGANYDNGQNRVLALAIAGNGDIVVGEDTISAARVVYVDGNGNKINKSVIGNVGDGKWHTISLEMTKSSIGYDVVIKVDGEKLGNTLSMKSNISFSDEALCLTQLMIFGGNSATVAQVEALGDNYKCTCEFDNFVIYAK